MAWTDTCKIEAANQVKELVKREGISRKQAIERLSGESDIPYGTLERWVYPRKPYVKNDVTQKAPAVGDTPDHASSAETGPKTEKQPMSDADKFLTILFTFSSLLNKWNPPKKWAEPDLKQARELATGIIDQLSFLLPNQLEDS